jgi:G:T/U-mismatch repair DNA glycosylase
VECNKAEFFYGRVQNHFWKLLPAVFGEPSVKGDTAAQKAFVLRHDIELSDLILSVEMDEKDICNYGDDKLKNVVQWNTQNIIDSLQSSKTKEVYFTRKSFDKSVEGIKKEIYKIKNFCDKAGIKFRFLPTPARFFNGKKMQEWRECFLK